MIRAATINFKAGKHLEAFLFEDALEEERMVSLQKSPIDIY